MWRLFSILSCLVCILCYLSRWIKLFSIFVIRVIINIRETRQFSYIFIHGKRLYSHSLLPRDTQRRVSRCGGQRRRQRRRQRWRAAAAQRSGYVSHSSSWCHVGAVGNMWSLPPSFSSPVFSRPRTVVRRLLKVCPLFSSPASYIPSNFVWSLLKLCLSFSSLSFSGRVFSVAPPKRFSDAQNLIEYAVN